MKLIHKAALATALATLFASAPALAGDPIRTIDVFTRPQAAQPQEFQSVQLIAQEWRKLGLDVNVRVMPWEQMADIVWYQRDKWDVTAWQMVGRPERSDPDEIVYNLFHSSTAEKGYNFIGYTNPEFDAVAEAQRVEIDEAKRRQLVYKAQEILAADQPNMMLVHPKSTFAYDKTVWKPDSVVNQSGIGIRNTWTFMSLEPLGEQRDIIVNSGDNVQAVNPLYISGGVDSWVTELLYDRLARVGPDGLPKPWAAESYEWKDDKTIEVKLRAGMNWHDGKPVTVEDVKFSFDAVVSGEAPMYKPFATNVASIDIVDDRTLVFHLNNPAASFVTSSLAKINLIPKHVWEPVLEDLKTKEENAESYQEDTPIGSGPLQVRALADQRGDRPVGQQGSLQRAEGGPLDPAHRSQCRGRARHAALRRDQLHRRVLRRSAGADRRRRGRWRPECRVDRRYRLPLSRLQRAPRALQRRGVPPGSVGGGRPAVDRQGGVQGLRRGVELGRVAGARILARRRRGREFQGRSGPCQGDPR